jgi:uncharacterized membrane protein (DUF485 family)
MLVYVDSYLYNHFGITPLHRFIPFLIILIVLTAWGIPKSKVTNEKTPVITWLVPLWFHLFFFTWLLLAVFIKRAYGLWQPL